MSRRKQSKPQHVEKGLLKGGCGVAWKPKEIKVEYVHACKRPSSSRSNSSSPLASPEISMEQQDVSPPSEKRGSVQAMVVLKREKHDFSLQTTNHFDSGPSATTPKKQKDESDEKNVGDFLSNLPAKSRDFHCQGCGVSFLQESTLKVHVKSYCSGKRYKYGCSLCGAKFPDKKMWKIHEEVHFPKEKQEEADSNQAKVKETVLCPPLPDVSPTALTTVDTRLACSSSVNLTVKEPSRKRSAPALSCFSNANGTTRASRHSIACDSVSSRKDGSVLSVSQMKKNVSPHQIFACIVCDAKFLDVVNLQKHILLLHSRTPDRAFPHAGESDTPSDDFFGIKLKYSGCQSPSSPVDELTNGDVLRQARSSLPNDSINEPKRCTACNIAFESADNLRAHKKHYCSSRAANRASLARFSDSPVSKRHAASTPSSSDESDTGQRSKRKGLSLPSKEVGIKEMPICELSVQSNDVPRKRMYDCKECNIQFSRPDTYLAHKQYYCHNRRLSRSRQLALAAVPNRSHSVGSRDKVKALLNAEIEEDHKVQLTSHTRPLKENAKTSSMILTDNGNHSAPIPAHPAGFSNVSEWNSSACVPEICSNRLKPEVIILRAKEARCVSLDTSMECPVDLSLKRGSKIV